MIIFNVQSLIVLTYTKFMVLDFDTSDKQIIIIEYSYLYEGRQIKLG